MGERIKICTYAGRGNYSTRGTKMLEAVKDIPGEDVRRGLTRISNDHPLARQYPDHFREATDGPPSQGEPRYSDCKAQVRDSFSKRGPTASRSRMSLAEEDRRRRALLAEFDAPKRVESESSRRKRVFWSGAQALLDSL